jgi:hypothetical protein
VEDEIGIRHGQAQPRNADVHVQELELAIASDIR